MIYVLPTQNSFTVRENKNLVNIFYNKKETVEQLRKPMTKWQQPNFLQSKSQMKLNSQTNHTTLMEIKTITAST